jgi:hypothetical protein
MRALLIPLTLAAAIAIAAAGKPSPVTGAWSFKTQPYDGGCVMTGELSVSSAPRNGSYSCKLVARETCPDLKITAQQVCTLTEKNGKVAIKSSIALLSDPSMAYSPDNFELTLESAARMTGELRSADIAPVLFYRGEVPTS